MGGGPDQSDNAALDIGQENVLLRFVETMNFVNEENGRPAGVRQAICRRRKHPPHIGHVGFNPAEALEFAGGAPGNKVGQGGFDEDGARAMMLSPFATLLPSNHIFQCLA